MMLSTSRTVQRLPPLRNRTTAGKVCRPIQTRAFRFGIWSSYLDSAYHRELRRRHWTLKHKYLDNISKRLSWYDHPFAEEHRFTPKRTVTRFWPPTVVRSGFPWVSRDEIDSRKTASRPTYPPFHFDVKLRNAKLWGSYLDHIIEPLFNQTSPDSAFRKNSKASTDQARANTKPENPKSQKTMRNDTNTTIEQDYMIDPITNRKVPIRGHGPSGLEPPTRTPKPYRSQFAPFVPPNLDSERPPVYSNGQPPAAELSKYAENKFDDWPAAVTPSSAEPAGSSVRPEAASHTFDSSTLRNEEYSLNHLPLEDPIEDQDDLHKYQTTASNKSFLKSSDTKSNSDSDHLQPDPKSQQLQSELQKYGPYTYNEDSPSSTDPEELKDLEQYRHRVSEVPESSTEKLSTYDDLHKYETGVLDEPKDQEKLFKQYGDLEKYKDFRTQHLDTAAPMECDTVAESLKEYEAKEQGDGISDASNSIIRGVPGQIPKMTLPEGHVFSKNYSSETGAGKTNSPNDSSGENLRQQMDELSATSDAINHEISSDLQKTRQDFTEDKSIVQDEEKNLNQDVSDTSKEFAQSALDQLRNISRLEPALNRRASATKRNRLNRVFGGDFYSKEPQGLETSFSEECGGRQTMPLYTRTYGSEPGQATPRAKPATESESKGFSGVESDTYYHRDPEIDGIPPSESTDSARSPKTMQPDEPTVYKILAYDPSTQSIKIAETSSVVPDSTSPISPTEVLPRLSNPTKFFPHFAPLQAEGFEIVSGSGNVLVFRQMRPAKAAAQDGTTYVNPIDMMGRSAAVPNAAAFVSPTGFVNYDMPGVGEEIADRAGRSSASIDREGSNPALGEKQSSSENKKGKKKRMNVGKRIVIGGAWAAGISYAIGVVSEYFYTGGTDGKGPEGFSPI
ncbi:hypothetical protein EV127DRAFT_439950 [Xylaria flabelliformis]|nr:hypothetical protein EV127DRAFT_439950 [Xylaria flabelliformis]